MGSPPDVVPGDSGETRFPFGNDKQSKLHLRENGSGEGLIKSSNIPSATEQAAEKGLDRTKAYPRG